METPDFAGKPVSEILEYVLNKRDEAITHLSEVTPEWHSFVVDPDEDLAPLHELRANLRLLGDKVDDFYRWAELARWGERLASDNYKPFLSLLFPQEGPPPVDEARARIETACKWLLRVNADLYFLGCALRWLPDALLREHYERTR